MRKLQFICEDEPNLYPFEGETFLYNSAPYLQLKAGKFGSPLTFYALKGQQAVVRLHFFLQKKNDGILQAVSLPESPFGSLEYGEVTYIELRDFLNYVIDKLRSTGVNLINIKDCIPAYRNLNHISVESLLQETGFILEESLPNHHVMVDHESLQSKMHRMEQKRLRKCKKAGFHFQQESIVKLEEIYNFLTFCRWQKGWKLSLSLLELKQQQKLSPGVFSLFSVFHNDERVAAALCIKVNRSLLYDFYHGSPTAYKSYSPVTMLLDGIYHYCRQTSIRLLDMGTSPVESLQNFKKHCGGTPSFKNVYSKVLR